MLRDMAELKSAQSSDPARLAFLSTCAGGHGHGLIKINIRDLPLSGKLQSDLIQLEHGTPGVGVENGITPCRLSACSMLSSVEATLVGGLLPLPSQYRTDRG
jgi:hypothetical protein